MFLGFISWVQFSFFFTNCFYSTRVFNTCVFHGCNNNTEGNTTTQKHHREDIADNYHQHHHKNTKEKHMNTLKKRHPQRWNTTMSKTQQNRLQPENTGEKTQQTKLPTAETIAHRKITKNANTTRQKHRREDSTEEYQQRGKHSCRTVA